MGHLYHGELLNNQRASMFSNAMFEYRKVITLVTHETRPWNLTSWTPSSNSGDIWSDTKDMKTHQSENGTIKRGCFLFQPYQIYMVQFLQTAQIMGEINKFWEGPIAKWMDLKLGFWPMPAEIGLSKNWVPAKSKALGQDPLTLSPGAVCFFRKVHKWAFKPFSEPRF